MSTKPPADPAMERSANPVRPAIAPPPRMPAAPPQKSGFQRFMLQFLLLVIALGGAFGTGYLANANEMQLNRSDLLQQQLDAQERILALEQQIAELREIRASGNRVELDLTEVFEPIREAVGRIALVRMGEISREITTELSRLVDADLPAPDDSANAAGTLAPGGPLSEQAPEPETASATGEPAAPQSAGPGSLQPNSAASDVGTAPDQPGEIELVDSGPDGNAPPAATTTGPAASISSPVGESPVAEGLAVPLSSEETPAQEASRSEALDSSEGGNAIVADASMRREPAGGTELAGTQRPPGSTGRAPITEP